MRIFVSSTSDDLQKYRAAAVNLLQKLGHDVTSMDGYTADHRGPVEKVLDDVSSAEVYVGLFAFHYGFIPYGYNISVTELEFRKASELGLPCLIFLIPDDADWNMKYVDRGETFVRIDNLRRDLWNFQAQDQFTVRPFHDLPEFLTSLSQSIQEYQTRSCNSRSDRPAQNESFRDLAIPLTFEAERTRHLPQFTGREWVNEKLEDWLTNRRSSQVFCLIGDPGIGKTAIACHWCHTRSDIVAFHYCIHGHKEKTDPKRILLSLAGQMASRLPEYEQRLSAMNPGELREAANGDARAVFDVFLLKPLNRNMSAPDGDRLVVIDALDEAGRDLRNEVAGLIGEVWSGLPRWLRLVATSRPEFDVYGYLEHLQPFILNAGNPKNLQDVRTFLHRKLDAMQIVTSIEMINDIVDKSEGLFLYAKAVLDELREGRLSLDRITDFPEGLTGYYKRWFTRKFPNHEVYQEMLHKVVSVIVAQRGLLPVTTLGSALELRSYDLEQLLMKLGALFPLREEYLAGQHIKCVTLMHKSLHDWLTEDNPATLRPRAGIFKADLDLGNRFLAEEGWRVYTRGELVGHPYFEQTLLVHLSEAKEIEKMVSVLLNPNLLDTLWSKDARYEWVRHISNLRRTHSSSLSNLVHEWIGKHATKDGGTSRIAAAAAKLARLFQEMGAFDEAMLLAKASLEICTKLRTNHSAHVVQSLLVLGRILYAREQLQQATDCYERALAIAECIHSRDSQEMADVLYELCCFYTKGKRDYEKACDSLEKCLAIRSSGDPPDVVGMANCINDKAVVLEAQGKSGDYLALYERALCLFEQAHPKGHPEMVSTLINIANQLDKQGRSEDARGFLERAVNMADAVLLPQHEYYMGAIDSLASILIGLGKYNEAVESMREHVGELERYPGSDHDKTVLARLWLCSVLFSAVCLSSSGQSITDYYDDIHDQCQKIMQAKPEVVLGLLNLSEASRRATESELQECFLATARRSCSHYTEREHSNPAEAVSAEVYRDIFETLMFGREMSESKPEVLARWDKAISEMEPETDCLPRTRNDVVSLLSCIGRIGVARDADVAEARTAFDLITEIGAESPKTLDQLASLTVALHNRHHDTIAELLSERLVEISERTLGSKHIQSLTYVENLAHYKVHLGKFEESERLYRSAFQSRMETLGLEQFGTLSDLVELTKCLLLGGSVDQARDLVRKTVPKLSSSDAFTSSRKFLAASLTSVGMELKNEFATFEESKICYEISLEVDAENATTYNNMAALLWTCLGDPDRAVEHFRHSLTLKPNDGITESNYGHLLAQTLVTPEEAIAHFEKAITLAPNNATPPANYAAMLLLQGKLKEAWHMASRSMKLCLPHPDRIMIRPLFCATAILLLRQKKKNVRIEVARVPLGQIKQLLTRGIDHVPWVITALLEELRRNLPPDLSDLMEAISAAVDSKENLKALEGNPTWKSVVPISFETAWTKEYPTQTTS